MQNESDWIHIKSQKEIKFTLITLINFKFETLNWDAKLQVTDYYKRNCGCFFILSTSSIYIYINVTRWVVLIYNYSYKFGTWFWCAN